MTPAKAPQTQRRRAVGRLTLAALLIFGALGLLPALAQAAPAHFTYELCDSALPGGNPPKAQFVVNPGVALSGTNTCSQAGGSLEITETGHVQSTFAYWSVPIPATPKGWVKAVNLSGAACGLGAGNDHTFVYEQGWPASLCTESTRYFHLASAPSFFGAGMTVMMNCDGNVAGGCNAGPVVFTRYIAATEADPTPPAIGTLEGSVLSGEILRGHQELTAGATDVGGGLSKISILVNGLPAGEPTIGACGVAQVKNPSYTGTVALTPSPCPSTLTGSWTLDTASYPFQNGSNSVQVCAFDFSTAGDANTTCSTPQTVQVNNSCTESSVSGGRVLNATFAGSGSEAVTTKFGKSAELTGTLADAAGDPISGATICVQAQVEGEPAPPAPIATTRTDAHGEFTYKVPPGPNRDLLIAYRRDSFQVGRKLSVHAHAQPSLRIRPSRVTRGGTIRLTGTLPGPDPAERVIILQAATLHGSRWLTFREAVTNRNGHYHASYRFDRESSTITYRFRALVLPQSEYKYDAGTSKPVRVKVRAGAR
jgi:hypothetical protein